MVIEIANDSGQLIKNLSSMLLEEKLKAQISYLALLEIQGFLARLDTT